MSNTISVLQTNILAGSLDVLREEFQLAKICTKDFDKVAQKKGAVVSYSKPVAQTASDIAPAATMPALVDTTVTANTYTMDQWKGSRFYLTSKERQQMTDDSSFIPNQVKEAARAVLHGINTYTFGKYKTIYGYTGTAGTTPFASNLDVLADCREVLNGQQCPRAERNLILSYAAETKMLKLSNVLQAMQRGSADTLNSGEIGSLEGFKIWSDIDVPTHTAGTITTGLIAKASTVVAVGATSAVCTTAASTGACALKEGDIIVFSGDTQTYALTADATQASAATDVTLSFSPGKKVALAGSETVTVKASHVVNIAMVPSAFRLGMALNSEIMDEDYTAGMIDAETGIPLMLSELGGYHVKQYEVSALYGGAFTDPRLAARIAG